MNKILFITYMSVVGIVAFILLAKGVSVATMIWFMVLVGIVWVVLERKFSNV